MVYAAHAALSGRETLAGLGATRRALAGAASVVVVGVCVSYFWMDWS
jgi:hypothetical protein